MTQRKIKIKYFGEPCQLDLILHIEGVFFLIKKNVFCVCLVKVLQDELHRKILDSLLDFSRKCSSIRRHGDWASQMRASEIPTAALMLGTWREFSRNLLKLLVFWRLSLTGSPGVNVPDHDLTFNSLSDLLRQSVTPYVVSLQAKECGGKYTIFLKSPHKGFSEEDLLDFCSTKASDEEGPRGVNGYSCGRGWWGWSRSGPEKCALFPHNAVWLVYF